MAPPLFGSIAKPKFPPVPPWFVIDSHQLAALLGVGMQTLCLWRRRGIGPEPEPDGLFREAQGRKKWYRLDRVMAWVDSLHGQSQEPWEYDQAFLHALLRPTKALTTTEVESLTALDWTDDFPDFPQPRRKYGKHV